MNVTDIGTWGSFPNNLEGLLKEYQSNLEWLNAQRDYHMFTPSDMERMDNIRAHLMRDILEAINWKQHFGVLNSAYLSCPEKSDIFLFDDLKKCIRKYDGYWYILDVNDVSVSSGIITTTTPYDQLENGVLESADDPVTLMVHVLKEKFGIQ